MDAVRCPDCGDVRWSFSGFGAPATRRCDDCGTAMLPEGRAPLHLVAAEAQIVADPGGPGPAPPAA